MKKTKLNHAIEYLSSTLILSYFFIHNIFLVLIGITSSLYLININLINRIIKSIYKILVNKKESIEINAKDTEIETNPINKQSTKEDIKLTLVEAIEELGFIPSLDNSNETNVT
ncbi:hypothetical protein [Prochlorococcus marinus]|uniref:hypothetical protein n=1 Tax=Prochlorococcus marinus TaxID=1219 RepID=UPI0039AEDBE5